jgi:hypothetical protein
MVGFKCMQVQAWVHAWSPWAAQSLHARPVACTRPRQAAWIVPIVFDCGYIQVKECIRTNYLASSHSFLQNELDSIVTIWNNHTIRKSRRNLPSGRPNVMYQEPSLYNTRSYITPMHPVELGQHRELCTARSSIPCDEDMYDLCCCLMAQNNWQPSNTANGAVEMYLNLRELMRNALHIWHTPPPSPYVDVFLLNTTVVIFWMCVLLVFHAKLRCKYSAVLAYYQWLN